MLGLTPPIKIPVVKKEEVVKRMKNMEHGAQIIEWPRLLLRDSKYCSLGLLG